MSLTIAVIWVAASWVWSGYAFARIWTVGSQQWNLIHLRQTLRTAVTIASLPAAATACCVHVATLTTAWRHGI